MARFRQKVKQTNYMAKARANEKVNLALKSGGLGRIRTCDQAVMSRPLCR